MEEVKEVCGDFSYYLLSYKSPFTSFTSLIHPFLTYSYVSVTQWMSNVLFKFQRERLMFCTGVPMESKKFSCHEASFCILLGQLGLLKRGDVESLHSPATLYKLQLLHKKLAEFLSIGLFSSFWTCREDPLKWKYLFNKNEFSDKKN